MAFVGWRRCLRCWWWRVSKEGFDGGAAHGGLDEGELTDREVEEEEFWGDERLLWVVTVEVCGEMVKDAWQKRVRLFDVVRRRGACLRFEVGERR